MECTAWIMVAFAYIGITSVAAFAGDPARPTTPPGAPRSDRVYLFAYFTDSGQDGMRFAASGDGLVFSPLADGRPFLKSTLGEGLVRDPSIVRGTDGRWHCVWTTGWWTRGFGLAHSDDLVTWTEPEWVGVMEKIDGAVNTWAPEIHRDDERREYLVLWSSTVLGRFPETADRGDPGPGDLSLNHRIYAATTKDFQSWPEARLFYDPGFNCIDATLLREDRSGRWAMILKNETVRPEPEKNLRVAWADSMQGPYGPASESITPRGVWAEGPGRLKMGDGWIIYYDRYREDRFGALRTRDFREFEDVSDQVSLPAHARHGTVIEVTRAELARLESK